MPPEERRYSVSQIQAYLGCPLKYSFQYLDQLPKAFRPAALAFGGSVHSAAEWFNRERLAGRTPDLTPVLKVFEADWYAQNLEPLAFSERESQGSLQEKGRAMLQLYVESANGVKPVAVEEPFELELCDPETGECLGVYLRGVIDLVEEGGTVVDLKTAARAMDAVSLEQHLQLSTYALCYLLLRGAIPKLRLDVLTKTQKPKLERMATVRTLEDLAWTAHLIESVRRSIEAGHFFPNRSWRCGECEFLAHCQRWRG